MLDRDLGLLLTTSERIRSQAEFPTDPEKRFEAIFAAIGNSEAKCVTILCLSENPITGQDLWRKFLSASDRSWSLHSKTPAMYCSDTLVPIGLVDEVDIVRDGSNQFVVGFRLTQAGRNFGQPIAASLLEQSTNMSESLLTIFGQTAKTAGETSTVINRARILEYLKSAKPNLSSENVVENLGLAVSTVGDNLRRLSKLGLVHYKSLNMEDRGLFKYNLVSEALRSEVQVVAKSPILTGEVANLLFEYRRVDVDFLVEKLYGKRRRSKSSLGPNVSSILSGLVRQGICAPEEFVANKILSRATISERGRAVFTDILQPLQKALSGDNGLLDKWRQINWRTYAKTGVAKYKEASGRAEQESREEVASKVLTVITENSGIRTKEIALFLGRDVSHGLKDLLDKGLVTRVKKGKAATYYPESFINPSETLTPIS